MKKQTFIASFLLFALLLVSPFSAEAQNAKRVKFARGATSSVVTGTLRNYKGQIVYLVRVKEGQSLMTEQVSNNNGHYVSVGITDPDGEEINDADASCNNNKTVENTKAGDYKITVYECMKADEWRGTFKLKIAVK